MFSSVLEICLKIAAGTAAFALYRTWARRAHHSHAGMMLTFPALNGLGLAFTGEAGTSAKAAAMMPMIAVNGGLCFAGVALAPMLGRLSRRAAFALCTAALLIWLGAAFVVPPLAPAWHVPLLLAFILGGWCWSRRTWPIPHASVPKVRDPWWKDRWLWAFGGILGCLLIAAEFRGSHYEEIGKASALPLLPLFGLASQMTKGPDALEKFQGTVLLGPAIAMTFVMVMTVLIQHDVLSRMLSLPHSALSMLYVAVGWFVCVKTIDAIARRAERL